MTAPACPRGPSAGCTASLRVRTVTSRPGSAPLRRAWPSRTGRRHPRRHDQPRRGQQDGRPARAHPHHRLGGRRAAGRGWASPGSCAAACGRSRPWPARPTGSPPVTSPTGSARRIPAPRWAAWARRSTGCSARIEASVEEREASQELTRRFFADASHELRNPLASLRANAELYQQGALAERPQVDEAMRRIALEAQRMSGLVDDMLRLARLDQHPGQRARPGRPHRPGPRVRRAGPASPTPSGPGTPHRARPDDRRRRGAAAPGHRQPARQRLRAHPGRHRRHHHRRRARRHRHRSRSATTAPASRPTSSPRIFDRFYRGQRPLALPGSGLGLAIVAAIAAAHHGTAQAAPNHPHGLRHHPHPPRHHPLKPGALGPHHEQRIHHRPRQVNSKPRIHSLLLRSSGTSEHPGRPRDRQSFRERPAPCHPCFVNPF